VAAHTCATSERMVCLLVEMIAPPMRKIGTMSSIPHRRLSWSPTHPMIGSITRPGMTHSDATAKPMDRARGGMARDRVASTPGAMIAKAAVMTECAAMATQTLGAAANTTSAALTTRVTLERKPRMCSGPSAYSRVAARAP
jgi:hypothetical protein